MTPTSSSENSLSDGQDDEMEDMEVPNEVLETPTAEKKETEKSDDERKTPGSRVEELEYASPEFGFETPVARRMSEAVTPKQVLESSENQNLQKKLMTTTKNDTVPVIMEKGVMTRSQMRKATTDEQIHMVQMLARVIDDDPEVYDKLKQAILQEEETVDEVNMVGMTSDPGLPKQDISRSDGK